MNRFKGLDLVNRVPEELWIEICNTAQEAAKKKKKKSFQRKRKARRQTGHLRRLYK